jgi:hypothetical protein
MIGAIHKGFENTYKPLEKAMSFVMGIPYIQFS